MIKPTVGRIVLFTPSKHEPDTFIQEKQLAAIIAKVHSDKLVNLAVFDGHGVAHAKVSIPLLQDDDPVPKGAFCQWMDYQKSQAGKYEELEKNLKVQTTK